MTRSTHDMKPIPAADYLRECFTYRDDGSLWWRVRPRSHFATGRAMASWNGTYAHTKAGSVMQNGYRLICLDYKKYLEHRLIFQMQVRELATREMVDHIDYDFSNNRFTNLRACSHAQNLMNQSGRKRIHNLPKHVYWSKREGKYKVYLRANGQRHNFGTFETVELAERAAITARAKMHGEFSNSETFK